MAKPGAGRRVALGVCGSIAAYKACEVVRGLVRAGAEVRVVMTPSASRFVSPLTFSVLARSPAHQDPFDPALWDMAHLSLASWAEIIVVAPATADFMARLAAGNAGGLLEAAILSCAGSGRPVALCPAMDTGMWDHPATQENISRLKRFGYRFWGPVEGSLASGRVGMGRLVAPEEIVSRALQAVSCDRSVRDRGDDRSVCDRAIPRGSAASEGRWSAAGQTRGSGRAKRASAISRGSAASGVRLGAAGRT